jgi:hypothetical protein
MVSLDGALELALMALRRERVWKIWPTAAAHRECARLRRELAER